MTPARAWTPTSARRTTSSATSTAAGSTRPRSPRDRSTLGRRSCTLADTAEAAGARDHRGRWRPARPTREDAEDARKIGDLFASFMDTDRIDASRAPARSARCVDAVGGAARRARPGGVPRRVRADRRPRAVRQLRQHRRPRLRPLPLPHHPGRARAAGRVLLPRRQVRRDPREVRRLPRPTCSRSAAHEDAAGRGGHDPRRSTPGWPPATGSAPRPATCRRPTT